MVSHMNVKLTEVKNLHPLEIIQYAKFILNVYKIGNNMQEI